MGMLDRWEMVMKALGQPTRLKIIMLLASREQCVCELERIIGISQPAISQHMRVLKAAGLVKERRDGQWTYYRLDQENLGETLQLFSTALKDPRDVVKGMEPEWQRLDELERDPLVPCRPCGAREGACQRN
ncbi:MAG: ArsR/SmtB family transcription factor [Bacillota bacterium]